jgi:DnaJ-class molecular chaperone
MPARDCEAVLKRSYFLTLGCGTSADGTEIHHAFRKLAHQYHPDRLGPDAVAIFNDVIEAYRALRSPEQRVSYAKGLKEAEGSDNRDVIALEVFCEQSSSAGVPAIPHVLTRTEAKASPRGLLWEGVAGRILRNFRDGESPREKRPEAIALPVAVSVDDALEGGVALLQVPGFYPCAACHGSGWQNGEACVECGERGVVEECEQVRVVISPLMADHSRMEVPMPFLGIHNFYLRLCFRIAAG